MVKVVDRQGKEYEAMTCLPSKEYQDQIVNSARELGSPKEYIEKFLKKV